MRITLNVFNPQGGDQDSLVTLEVFSDMTVSTLRESVQAEAGIPLTSQHIYHNGRLISDDAKTMEQLHIGDGDMLAVHVRDMRGSTGPPELAGRPPAAARPQQSAAAAAAASASASASAAASAAASSAASSAASAAASGASAAAGAGSDTEMLRLQIMGDPAVRQQLSRQHPELAAAIEDPARFRRIFLDSQDRERREREMRQREIERLNEDPFNVENQRRIEEMIRQERVMENLQNAMEHNPEVFGRVHLLYANVEVNGHKVKALVDSGAQATIMSPSCAEACGIMRLVDKRFAGVARGVGTATIIGRVHSAQIKIGNLFLPCSFTVMEGKSVELLLGLDMLKRYQAHIDLERDKLIIQGQEIPFLGEAEIPKEEETIIQEPTIPGPAGTAIGQRSGAVMPAQDAPSRTASHPTPAPPPQAQTQQTRPRQPVAAPLPGAQPSASEAGVTPAHVDSLMSMGATREQAIQALQAAEDNVDMAASLIFF